MRKTLESLPPDLGQHRILDSSQSALFCGFSLVHWRRLYRRGIAPKPIRLSDRKLGWTAQDLISWIGSRARDDADA
jgi:predicted DNA-binding transcriptional regulator AlpA